jgi:hypothetical protein
MKHDKSNLSSGERRPAALDQPGRKSMNHRRARVDAKCVPSIWRRRRRTKLVKMFDARNSLFATNWPAGRTDE